MDDSFAERLLKRFEHQSGVGLVLWAVVITSLISALMNLFNAPSFGSNFDVWVENWLSDFSSDLAGAGLIFLFLKAFLARRENQQQTSNDKSLLVEAPQTQPKTFTYYVEAEHVPSPSISSNTNEQKLAEQAVEGLQEALQELLVELKEGDTPESRQVYLDKVREKEIFVKATLVGLNLQRADLHGVNMNNAQLTKANLREADLQGINLRGANLKETQLIEANLQGADLTEANLERAFLSGANLNGAKLERAKLQTSLWGVLLCNANLQGADLHEAELFKTNLTGANLIDANFEEAKFSTDMILPDGTHWNEKTEMERFTNPTHAEFWRSDDPNSPAYKGESAEVSVEGASQ